MILYGQIIACVTARSVSAWPGFCNERNECRSLVNYSLSPDVPGS